MEDLEDEVWKPIPGYEGRYDVSNMGRVRSYLRRGSARVYTTAQIVLRQGWSTGGYSRVRLAYNGTIKNFSIHRLVLIAFAGSPPPGREACHTGDVKVDNRLSKLRWDTHAENIKEAYRNGSKKPQITSKLTPEQAGEILALTSLQWTSYRVVARKYGVSHETIRLLRLRKTWKGLSRTAP